MEGAVNIELDDKNVIVMKLLHYFITEKNYNPIIYREQRMKYGLKIWMKIIR